MNEIVFCSVLHMTFRYTQTSHLEFCVVFLLVGELVPSSSNLKIIAILLGLTLERKRERIMFFGGQGAEPGSSPGDRPAHDF